MPLNVGRPDIVYEWDGLAERWLIDEQSFDTDFPTRPQDLGTSLAAHIVKEVFSLNLDSSSETIGGYLPGYDVVNREAYQMIQLSLAQHLKDKKFYECYANGDGIVKFYLIGEDDADVDILYQFDTGEWRNLCENVLVTGYDPPQRKYTRGPYSLFTFANIYSPDEFKGPGSPFYDADLGTYPKYWVWYDVLGPEACMFAREGYIEYANPFWDNARMDSAQKMNDAGIVKYYEFEKMIESIYKIHVPFFKQGVTQVNFSNRTPRFVELDSLGELMPRVWKSGNAYYNKYCISKEPSVSSTELAAYGVRLPRSNESKFVGVKEVYLFGFQVTNLTVAERKIVVSGQDTFVKMGNFDFICTADTTLSEPISLTRGEDYIVVRESTEEGSYYKIIFSSNVSPVYKQYFGGRLSSGSSNVRISSSAVFDTDPLSTDTTLEKSELDYFDESFPSGYLKSGQAIVGTDLDLGSVSIFALGDGSAGIVVKKIVVVYEWDNPCIAIYDSDDQVTRSNLEKVTIDMYPIIMQDLPAPVAHNGVLLDPAETLPDLNATTLQNLSTNTYQRAMTQLENGDISITLPFLDGSDCEKVSEFILELQNQIVTSTTYICGPDSEPVLGQLIEDKVINSIDYSYQDSSQYLISIQAGPIWQGIGGWDNSVYQNKTEQLQAEGVVRGTYPDNMKCQVYLEKFGIMECINGTTEILEKGDTVKVTLYNNPVSI